MQHGQPPFVVRCGLVIIRFFVFLKRAFIAFFVFIGHALAPLWRFALVSLVPIYRLAFFIRRRFAHSRRPIKNRFMFIVGNRFIPFVVVFCFTAVSVFGSFQLRVARAEISHVGQQSILYALVTHQRAELIDEEFSPQSFAESFVDSPRDLALYPILPESDSIYLDDEIGQDEAVITQAELGDGASNAALPVRTGVETYTVAAGDTLSTIARRFGISLETVLWANSLTTRSVLKVGMQLTILPTSGVLYTIKSGDTVLALAKKYGVKAEDVIQKNQLADAAGLRIGQQIVIPGGSPLVPSSARSVVSPRDVFVPPPANSQQKETGPASRMSWPTVGHYIVRKLSWFHTGFDIDCDGHGDGTSTADNFAADDGVVTYAGWRRGYGNTVEITHANGLMTRYGHHHALYVHSGDVVTRGQPIGRCGSTGNSSGTHLHFEVISHGKFLNPGDYLPL